MGKQVNINIRVDETVKKEAEMIFDMCGLNMSTAINIFLRQSIRKCGLPFAVETDVPNEKARTAMEEAKELMKDDNAKTYYTEEELMKAFGL